MADDNAFARSELFWLWLAGGAGFSSVSGMLEQAHGGGCALRYRGVAHKWDHGTPLQQCVVSVGAYS